MPARRMLTGMLVLAALIGGTAAAAAQETPPATATSSAVHAPTTQPSVPAPAAKPQAIPLATTRPVVAATPQAPQGAPPVPAGSAKPPAAPPGAGAPPPPTAAHGESQLDFMSMLFVFMLATFIGVGVIRRVSRLLHTPLMSLTNAISAIAVVGSIVLAGSKHYPNNWYHFWGAVALFASMTNIVSGFLITDRMLKMFKTREAGK